MKSWLFNCKEMSHAISESMDRKLPLHQKIGVKMHLLMCGLCRRYQTQILTIQDIFRLEKSNADHSPFQHKLSDDAKERIKKSISANIKSQ